ncbi:MAG: hypothetical protein RMY29_031245 [Nostoc sp. CreGUA01]|nr:hypothetical protein [Nostoc sp. CreGUA01]
MGHGAWGMGHGALDIGHWAWGGGVIGCNSLPISPSPSSPSSPSSPYPIPNW